MDALIIRFLLTACCFCPVAVGLTWLLGDQLFHPVPARCLGGKWVEGSVSTRRGHAFLRMQYEWQGRVYEDVRMYNPLEDSPRLRNQPEDIERAREWITANCRDQTAMVMYGLPRIAWYGDGDVIGWNSVIAAVVLRSLAVSALVAVGWTFIRRRRALPPRNHRS
jgi:hypothetical protein